MTGPQSCDVPPLILVAEDDPDTLDLFSILLEMRGFRTETAADGGEAWSKAIATPPDLVLTNVGLPGMDGFDLASRLRADARTRTVPIIAVTGWLRQDLDTRARQAGIDRCLVKPVSPDTLLSAVDSILHGREGVAFASAPPSDPLKGVRGRAIKAKHRAVRGRARPARVTAGSAPRRTTRAAKR